MEPLVWFNILVPFPLSWCFASDRNRQLGQRMFPAMPSLTYSIKWFLCVRHHGAVTVIRMWSWPSETRSQGEQALSGYGSHWRALGINWVGIRMCIQELNHTVGKVFPFGSFYNPYDSFQVKVSVWYQLTSNTSPILANLPFKQRKNSKSQAQSSRQSIDSSWT